MFYTHAQTFYIDLQEVSFQNKKERGTWIHLKKNNNNKREIRGQHQKVSLNWGDSINLKEKNFKIYKIREFSNFFKLNKLD